MKKLICVLLLVQGCNCGHDPALVDSPTEDGPTVEIEGPPFVEVSSPLDSGTLEVPEDAGQNVSTSDASVDTLDAGEFSDAGDDEEEYDVDAGRWSHCVRHKKSHGHGKGLYKSCD